MGSWIIGSNRGSYDPTLVEKKKKNHIGILNNHINYTFIYKKKNQIFAFI